MVTHECKEVMALLKGMMSTACFWALVVQQPRHIVELLAWMLGNKEHGAGRGAKTAEQKAVILQITELLVATTFNEDWLGKAAQKAKEQAAAAEKQMPTAITEANRVIASSILCATHSVQAAYCAAKARIAIGRIIIRPSEDREQAMFFILETASSAATVAVNGIATEGTRQERHSIRAARQQAFHLALGKKLGDLMTPPTNL